MSDENDLKLWVHARIAARLAGLAADDLKSPLRNLSARQRDKIADIINDAHGIGSDLFSNERFAVYVGSIAESSPELFQGGGEPKKPVDLKLTLSQRHAQAHDPDAFKFKKPEAPESMTTEQLAALPAGARLAALDGHRDASLQKKKGAALPPGVSKEVLAKMSAREKLDLVNGVPPPRMRPEDYK